MERNRMNMIILIVPLLYLIMAQETPPRNVLFLASDDLRPNLGCYEESNQGFHSPLMYTPNIDALAKRSLLLEKAYVQEGVCSPSRSSFLTSRRPDTTHVLDLHSYFREVGGNFTTIPQYFKQQGYRSLGMGKIFHPGAETGNDDPVSWTDKYFYAPDHYPGPWSPHGGNFSWLALGQEQIEDKLPQDTIVVNHAIEKLREIAPDALLGVKPFFLAVGLVKPHLPFIFPEEFLQYYPEDHVKEPENPHVPFDMPKKAWSSFGELRAYQDIKMTQIPNLGQSNVTLPRAKIKDLRRAYYSAVSYMDHKVGRILGELNTLGLEENTIIIFLGDHGWQLGEHSEWCKHTNFEIAARAPLMVHVPGYEPVRSHKLVEFVDIFPTLVEAAGFEPLEICPENSNDVQLCTEGSSMMPIMENTGSHQGKDAVFWQYPRGKMVDHIPDCMGYSLRTSQYHYTEWVQIIRLDGYNYEIAWNRSCDFGELYDLQDDPREDTNLFNNEMYQQVVEELANRLRSGWRQEIAKIDKT